LELEIKLLREQLAIEKERATKAEARVEIAQLEIQELSAKEVAEPAEIAVKEPSLKISTSNQRNPLIDSSNGYPLRQTSQKDISENPLREEVRRLTSKVAQLNAGAINEERAVRRMEGLDAEVQRLTDKLRQMTQGKQIAEQRASQEAQSAKEAHEKCDAAVKACEAARLDAERAMASVGKLTAQVKELQHQVSEDWLQRTVLQRQIDTHAEEAKRLNNLQNLLDEEKRSTQKLESQLCEEQKITAALREEFHARMLGDTDRLAKLENCSILMQTPKLSDEERIDLFGDVLKRTIEALPIQEGLRFKRQLLFCFHPDKNPALGIANRMSQILNSFSASSAKVGNQRKTQSNAGSGRDSARGRPAGSPMRTPSRTSSSPPPESWAVRNSVDRPQSARPRYRQGPS